MDVAEFRPGCELDAKFRPSTQKAQRFGSDKWSKDPLQERSCKFGLLRNLGNDAQASSTQQVENVENTNAGEVEGKETQGQRWTFTLDRMLNHFSRGFSLNEFWFGTQQRIIRRIATALNVQLSAERLKRLAGEPDVSLDVYDRWLRGQNLMAKIGRAHV